MFSLITIIISLIYVLNVEAGPYGLRNNYNYNGNYQYRNAYNRGGYHQNNYYRTPYQYQQQYQGYRTPYYQQYQQRQYQGYSSPYQYQGYGNNYYQNSYAQPSSAPTFQPSLAQLLFGGSQSRQPYSSGGINYDSYGNSYVGTKENGLYLFCNGKGCPGRG